MTIPTYGLLMEPDISDTPGVFVVPQDCVSELPETSTLKRHDLATLQVQKISAACKLVQYLSFTHY